MVIFQLAMLVFGCFSLNILKEPSISRQKFHPKNFPSEGPPSLPWQTSNPALMETFVGRADLGHRVVGSNTPSLRLTGLCEFEGFGCV